MTPTSQLTMATNNQNTQSKSALCRNDALRIRRAVAHVAGAIKGKPEPEDFWYDCGRNEDEAVNRNAHLDILVIRCRQALDKAKTQGIGIQAATVHRIEVMFATLCAMAVHGYEVGGQGSLATDLVRLSEETADVMTAAARVAHEPSERNLETLRYEIHEAIDIGESVADRAGLQLAGAR